jgi:hypothetical protein
VFLAAAAVLALCAAAVCRMAHGLIHPGAAHVFASAAILGAMAVGLARARAWAFIFAVAFFGLSALALVGLAVAVGHDALYGSGGGSGWEGVRTLVIAGAAITMGAVAFFLAQVPVGLALVRRRVAWPASRPGRFACVVGGLMPLPFLGWSIGHEYAYRQLPLQSRCLAGVAGVCAALAGAEDRFSRDERRAFQRRACEIGGLGSCSGLASWLGEGDSATAPDAQLIGYACVRGDPHLCQRLGEHLLRLGDAARARVWLEKACARDTRWCATAAKAALAAGETDFGDELLRRGCEQDEPRSCVLMLRRLGPEVPESELRRFHLRVCLLSDVNECRPLIRADMAGVCPAICEGTSPNRTQSCEHCARHAESVGALDLAAAWFALTCERGHRSSCRSLEALRGPTHIQGRSPSQVR